MSRERTITHIQTALWMVAGVVTVLVAADISEREGITGSSVTTMFGENAGITGRAPSFATPIAPDEQLWTTDIATGERVRLEPVSAPPFATPILSEGIAPSPQPERRSGSGNAGIDMINALPFGKKDQDSFESSEQHQGSTLTWETRDGDICNAGLWAYESRTEVCLYTSDKSACGTPRGASNAWSVTEKNGNTRTRVSCTAAERISTP